MTFAYKITSALEDVPAITGQAATREEVNQIIKKVIPGARGGMGILAEHEPMHGMVMDWDAHVIGNWRLEAL